MDKPKIELNGKTYEMIEPKARAWRLVSELDENKKDIPNVEFIERHAAIIAAFFNVSVEEVLDYMDLADVMKTFYDCYRYMNSALYSKLKKLDSTLGGEEAKV